jgi:hypothetical protein
VVFFGTINGGYAHAFEVSTALLAALLVGVAGTARRIPTSR